MSLQEETTPLFENEQPKLSVWRKYPKLICCLTFSFCLFFVCFAFIYTPLFFTTFYGFLIVFSPSPSDCVFYNPSEFYLKNNCLDQPLDVSSYLIPRNKWEEVHFFSRDEFWKSKGGGLISGYYLKNDPNKPTVIQVHGYRGCKQNGIDLLSSAILYKGGFNVLAIDLRNHGKSQSYYFQDPVVTFGSEEHKDILGAFDWLQNRTTKSIGVFGISMGGASSIIAAWKEPRIKAVFGDCAVCMIRETIAQIAIQKSKGFVPSESFLFGLICLGSWRSRYGCPRFENDPLEAIEYLKQPIHLDHHVDDDIVFKFNTDICGKRLKDRLGENATVYFETKKSNNSNCDYHTINYGFNLTGMEQRIISFFNKHL